MLDNLSQGHRAAVPSDVAFIEGDLTVLRGAFALNRHDAVFHFAGLSIVGDSMRAPLRYCRENFISTLCLAEAAVEAGCKRFVLSSSAALFTPPGDGSAIADDAVPLPQNAYGESKLLVERALAGQSRRMV